MSDDIARAIEDSYQEKDSKKYRHSFIARMEHKLHSKERRFDRR